MFMKNILFVHVAVSAFIWAGCGNPALLPAVVKMLPTDPFRNTITPSQYFTIDPKQDTVIEGKNGTVLVFRKGSLLTTNGLPAEGPVKIELTEALSLHDMLLSNLTTVSNGKPLITGGMLYFNATMNGGQLKISKDKPVHIRMPTHKKVPGMMAYKGARDSNGNMNWTDPKELEKFLVPADLKLLDFLPEHFAAAVMHNMPYKNHQVANPELTDSLYYMLTNVHPGDLVRGFAPTDLNEPYYNANKQVVNGKYTRNSYVVSAGDTSRTDSVTQHFDCTIKPSMIKVIKSDKYRNTLIATHEFEQRLRYIFKTCDSAVLYAYVMHLDKNLYELDSIAAAVIAHDKPGETELHERFLAFAKQRLTNVEGGAQYAEMLRKYFNTRLNEINTDLERNKEKMMAELNSKNADAEKLADEYADLLLKRETYRMEYYGFQWSETGWINIDIGTEPKDWGPQPLAVTIENGRAFDRTYTYIVYLSMKSLYRLNTTDNVMFTGGNATDNSVLMPKEKPAALFGVGYKNDSVFLKVMNITTGSSPQYSISLEAVTMEQFKAMIRSYEKDYKKENSITEDLNYMTKFYKEQLRQKVLINESAFFGELYYIAYPCCGSVEWATQY